MRRKSAEEINQSKIKKVLDDKKAAKAVTDEPIKKSKAGPLDLLKEYFNVQESIKRLEESFSALKASILKVPETQWRTNSKGSRFLWHDDEERGVQLIQSEPKKSLNREAAVEYCVKNKLKDCLKYSLDDSGFADACEEGRVPENVLRSLMVDGKTTAPYIRSISNIPSEGDDG